MDIRDQLISEIDSYKSMHGLSDKKLGETLMRDPTFIYRLRNGAGVTLRTVEKIRAHITAAPVAAKQGEGIFE